MFSKVKHIAELFKSVQDRACTVIEGCVESRFSIDEWEKPIGIGTTRVMTDGECIEKGAINFSNVEGKCTHEMAKAAGKKGERFAATGVSSIFHPVSPFIPIIHFNIRYFQLDTGEAWFGGGIDLTPHYVDKAQAYWFHRELKTICDKYNPNYYPEFKKQADNYYFLPHRNETRGIGGIFFDQLRAECKDDFDQLLAFCLDLGHRFPEIYCRLIQENSETGFGMQEKKWQSARRSRYVEFNLVYDRGTKFGLASGGNTESILVSMPPSASWNYHSAPEPDSEEEKTVQMLKKGIDWLKE